MGNKKGISGYTLKMIALVTMLIDHTAYTVVEGYLYGFQYGICDTFINESNYQLWQNIYYAMRGIGRMAFPIYCFLLVEGFLYTKNVKKYIGRLFIFAILSEIPFDIAIFHSIKGESFFTVFDYWGDTNIFFRWLRWMMSYQNVYFTLCLGLITIVIMDWIRLHFPISQKSVRANKLSLMGAALSQLAVVAAFALLAEFVFHSDYSAAGIFAIVMMFLFRQNRMLAFGAGVVTLAVTCDISEALALLMLVPIYFYNGTRGKQAKYVFYGFYPVHLLGLGLICLALGIK